MRIKIYLLLWLVVSTVFLQSCSDDIFFRDGENIDRSKLKDWTAATHGKLTNPAYPVVFSENEVNTLEITLGKTMWDSIGLDMKSRLGKNFGEQGPPVIGAPGGGGAPDLVPGDPRWVECTVRFNNKLWERVGFRLKGNSSLSGAWRSGIYKLPFKLQFDEYEDKYKEVTDQRFFGFKEFSMSPAYLDPSLMRDKLVSDIFRSYGVPAGRTAFYKIYIDFGEGLKYCGVYTLVEVIDDTLVKNWFGESEGNIYKPESNFTTFNSKAFEKMNNVAANDYGDIQNAINALNAPNRKTDPDLWRKNLDNVFNTDLFLKYLAVNNTIVNWDVYGAIAHNHYTYTPANNKKVTWIPWDFNLSLTSNTGPGLGGSMFGRGLSFEMKEVGQQWPLIRFLADDPVYFSKYKEYVREFINSKFTPQKMNAILDKEVAMIEPSVAMELRPYSHLASFTAFKNEITKLKTHFTTRHNLAKEFTQ